MIVLWQVGEAVEVCVFSDLDARPCRIFTTPYFMIRQLMLGNFQLRDQNHK
jgi:hypothetical protein